MQSGKSPKTIKLPSPSGSPDVSFFSRFGASGSHGSPSSGGASGTGRPSLTGRMYLPWQHSARKNAKQDATFAPEDSASEREDRGESSLSDRAEADFSAVSTELPLQTEDMPVKRSSNHSGRISDADAVDLLSREILSKLEMHEDVDADHMWSQVQVEAWLRQCGFRPPNVLNCAVRCATLRKERQWPMCIHARDVVDVLVTGAYQVLPGQDSYGRSLLVATLHAVDQERCPQEQYYKCLSYLLQDIAEGQCREVSRALDCPKLVLIIDARKDVTGAKTMSLVNFVLGGVSDDSSTWVTAKDDDGVSHLLCDPGLSCSPLILSSVIVLNAGAVTKAALLTRRSSWGGELAGAAKGDRSGWLRRDTSSTRVGSPMTLIGGTAEEWEKEIGESGLGILPESLGGTLTDWGVDLSISHRIQMEDLPSDSIFVQGMRSFLSMSHAFRCASTCAAYSQALSGCMEPFVVPVTWVRRALGALEEATLAEAAPWRGRHGKGVREELVQLHKDMQRDVACINGQRVDMSKGKQDGAKGAVIDILAGKIEAAANTGRLKLGHVQCQLAARDILLSTKRTTSGGDTWVCVESLCRNEKLVVVCPSSEEAEALNINVAFVPCDEIRATSNPAKKMLASTASENRPRSLRRYRRAGGGSIGASDAILGGSLDPPKLRRSLSAEGKLAAFDAGIDMVKLARRNSLAGRDGIQAGFISVVCKTTMKYKVCESNPLDEVNTVLAFVSCQYERHFSVGDDGLEGAGVEANETTPIVSISIQSSRPSHSRDTSAGSGQPLTFGDEEE